MIIPDVNVLIYAYDDTSPYHDRCRLWWEATINSGLPVGLPWAVIFGFVRITTHARALLKPIPISLALATVESWLNEPNVSVIEAGPNHWREFSHLLQQAKVGSNWVTNAHIATIAREYRATVATNDRDYQRFSGISLLNPLDV